MTMTSAMSQISDLFPNLALILFLIPCWSCSLVANVHSAILVAAVDSSAKEQARADLVCDGVDDQVELTKSLALGRRSKTEIDVNPKTQRTVECTLNHAVEWLPGNYNLSATLEIPDAANSVIRAEGTTLRYKPGEGDAVIVRGMNRCRYYFGTIVSSSSGAALRIQPHAAMPALMSFVTFTGLQGKDARGTGLLLDPMHENICVNRIEGTDVLGFERGVVVGGVGARDSAASTHGKCDTNWFWLSYIRMCNTCIEEYAGGVDSNVWEVNVDASLPGATAICAAGAYGKWYIIMGTYTYEKKNFALILKPGARHSVFEIHPPLSDFAWDDRSGNDTNVVLLSDRLPHRKFSELRAGPTPSAP